MKYNIKNKRISHNRLTIDEVSRRLNVLNFKLKDSTYDGLNKKYTLECSKGHVFNDKLLRHILSKATGCPQCSNIFRSERLFRESIERVFKTPFPKSRPEWLINLETGRRLELDCYNNELGLAFEYDGQFHYEVRKGIENNLEQTKKLDKLKDDLCNLNGVKLVRVPYFLKGKDFYNKIIEGLKLAYREDYYKIIKNLEIECNRAVINTEQ